MQKSILKINEHSAFCAPGCQNIGGSPIRISIVVQFKRDGVVPFWLTIDWYSAFKRGKLFVNNPVSFEAI